MGINFHRSFFYSLGIHIVVRKNIFRSELHFHVLCKITEIVSLSLPVWFPICFPNQIAKNGFTPENESHRKCLTQLHRRMKKKIQSSLKPNFTWENLSTTNPKRRRLIRGMDKEIYLTRKTRLVGMRESFHSCLDDGNANRRRWRRENGGKFEVEISVEALTPTLTLTVRTCPYSKLAITDGNSLQRQTEQMERF